MQFKVIQDHADFGINRKPVLNLHQKLSTFFYSKHTINRLKSIH